ncbi:hypothetical protein SGRI78S_06484 [Streptomyces griseus subsp. griseus]
MSALPATAVVAGVRGSSSFALPISSTGIATRAAPTNAAPARTGVRGRPLSAAVMVRVSGAVPMAAATARLSAPASGASGVPAGSAAARDSAAVVALSPSGAVADSGSAVGAGGCGPGAADGGGWAPDSSGRAVAAAVPAPGAGCSGDMR